jgi:hypothetical protein
LLSHDCMISLVDWYRDEALSQQIAESLTHSGVLSNFERQKRAQRNGPSGREMQIQKTQWHDLNYTERIEAASQVHAVVFAQLSALAHSMLELKCGLERSCAFVRRMSIRNQLPSSQRTILLKHLVDRHRLESNPASPTMPSHPSLSFPPTAALSIPPAPLSRTDDEDIAPDVTKDSEKAEVTQDELLKLTINDEA